MIEVYDLIDALGYQSMPGELYQQWLSSLEDAKRKDEAEILNGQIKQDVQTKN